MQRRGFLRFGLLAACALRAAPALAEGAYPVRPIRLVVPAPPGGIFDAVGRAWADKAKAQLTTIVIENQAGAGGALGAANVVQADPDGYTLLVGGLITNVINTVALSKRSYDPTRLEPISLLGSNCYAIAVHPALPVTTLPELVAYAKAHPGELSYGTAGVGSLNHLTGELFKSLAGIPDVAHVPYRGAGPALVDLLGGQIKVAVLSASEQIIELHHTGKLHILALTAHERMPAARDIPITAELGFGTVNTEQLIGLYAPPATPAPIVARLAEATRQADGDQDYRDRLAVAGFDAYPDPSPDRMRGLIADQFATWTPIIKSIGLRLD